MQNKHTVTIVIPNYNGMAFLDTCLTSLEGQTYQQFRILVVDNGSTDGSAEWLHARESARMKVIYLQENTGFAAAVNTGIRAAKTPYVLLLNNDIRADEHFVAEMVRAISRSKKIFSAAARMIRMYEPELMDSAGDQYTVAGWAFNRGTGRRISHYNRPCRVFSACAGAAIYRRAVFEKIGYFDERHFAYLEDIDVGYRARLYGYTNIYAPRAVVWHVGSGTSGSRYNEFKVRLTIRNNIWLNYKNMPDWQLVLNALPITLGIAVKYVFFVRKGLGKAFLEGLKEGIRERNLCVRVPFNKVPTQRFLMIEADLIANFAEYLGQTVRRRRETSQ